LQEVAFDDPPTKHRRRRNRVSKDIRAKLNALDLERQPPKSKSKGIKKCTKEEPIEHTLPGDGVGGKAGKSFFVVQVGEV
jgi:hypothetical protein